MGFAQKLDLGRARIASDRVALTNTKHVGWHLAWVLRANFFLTDCRLIVVDQHDTIKASSVFIICPTITSLGKQFIDSRCLLSGESGLLQRHHFFTEQKHPMQGEQAVV